MGKRVLVLVMALSASVLGIAPAAHAAVAPNHCNNEPFPEDVGVDVGPGVLFVGAEPGNGVYHTYKVCVATQTTSVALSIDLDLATPPGVAGNVELDYCLGNAGGYTCTEVFDPTGAGVYPGPCDGAAGACMTAYLFVDGTPIRIAKRTGVDTAQVHAVPDLKFGNSPSQIITCVGNACLYSFTVTFGNVHVYVDDEDGDPRVEEPACIRVGPNPPSCAWVSGL